MASVFLFLVAWGILWLGLWEMAGLLLCLVVMMVAEGVVLSGGL